MINDYLDNEQKIVILAGAGISKESPSNLPSWWEYNMLLLKTINDLAALELPNNTHPLNQDTLEKYIPVVSVSDFIVRSAMGKGYFPLLKLLEGSQPNNNHYALATLAKNGKIASIITTNFDTLIEQAFLELKVPHRVIKSDKEYQDCLENDTCLILKIHGSVTSEESLIDTITQKMQGLSLNKRECIKLLLRKYPLFVLGFSGDDLRFDVDYIPISEALKCQFITWVKHPGGSINSVVERLTRKDNFILHEMTLTSFFENLGIVSHYKTVEKDREDAPFASIALPIMYKAMNNLAVGSMGCLGLCLRLLDDIGETEKAIQYSDIMLERLKTEKVSYRGIPAILLLFSIGIVNLRIHNYNTALFAFFNELRILQENLSLLQEICTLDEFKNILNEYGSNLGAIWINIGLCYFFRDDPGDLELSIEAFTRAQKEFLSVYKLGGCLLATFNLARCNYKSGLDFNYYIKILRDISKSAKHNGESYLLIDALVECIEKLIEFGEYDAAWKYIEEAEEILDIIISIKYKVKLYLCKAELYIRRNQHKQCWNELAMLNKLLDDRDSDIHLAKQVRIYIIKLLGCYEEYKDFVQESILYLQKNIFTSDQYAASIEKALNALKSYGCLFTQPFFLDIDFHSELSKEDMLRKTIIFKEYYGEVNDLPRLFYELLNILNKEVRIARDEDLSYGFYMSTKRTECGILKLEAMLIYGNALAESENFELAQKIVTEILILPRISSEEYDTILGCAYGLLSYLLSVLGCETEAEGHYTQSLKLLCNHPDDMKTTVYKRANSFARKGLFEKALDTLLADMPTGTITQESAQEFIDDWKKIYGNR